MRLEILFLLASVLLAPGNRDQPASTELSSKSPVLVTKLYYVHPVLLSRKVSELLPWKSVRPDQGAIIDLAEANGIAMPQRAAAGYVPVDYKKGVAITTTSEGIDKIDKMLSDYFGDKWTQPRFENAEQ